MSRGQASRYKRIRKLGAGSLGVVYEVYDRERDTNVALKQLRTLSATGLLHLRREFRVLRGTSHPNIIELYELVTDETPPFFTMELIDGQDFVSYARERQLLTALEATPRTGSNGAELVQGLPRFSEHVNEDRLRSAFAQVVQAVQVIHECGIVHRDLKPANVLVTKEGRAVVMDFSIAVDARVHVDEWSSGGMVIGTPHYAAPEQGAGDPAGPAADWYALGVILYQAITGQLPFTGTWDRVLESKQAYDARSVAELVAEVPEDLQALCAALLARHPHKRPTGHDTLARLGVSELHDKLTRQRQLEQIPFVGRKVELARLQRAWQRTMAGPGMCVLVTGREGMGKTRLVRELSEQLQEAGECAVLWFENICYPIDHRPYNAFDDVVDQLSRTLAARSQELSSDLSSADRDLLVRMFPVCSRIPGFERLPRIQEGNLEALRARAIDVLRALLLALARERPLCLFIDDAHFADRDSIHLLLDLFGAVPLERVLLVLAACSSGEHAALDRLLALARESDAHIDLQPLAPGACDHILARMGIRDASDENLFEIYGGVPRRLIELIQSRSSSFSSDPSETAARAQPSHHSSVPLLAGLLDASSGPERALLDLCALLGHPAPLSLLAGVAELSLTERKPIAEALRSRGLLRRVRDGREPWLAIGHEAIRNLALSRLSTERRHELSNRLVIAMQRSGNAGNSELGTGWRAANDPERAFAYLELAAKGARHRFAFHRSAAAWAAAIDCAPAAGPVSVRLTLARAEVLARAGHHRQAAELFERLCAHDGSTVHVYVRTADHYLRASEIAHGMDRLLEYVSQKGPPNTRSARTLFASWIRSARVSWLRCRYHERDDDEVSVDHREHVDSLSATAASSALIAPEVSDAAHTKALLLTLRCGERRRAARALASELLRGLVRQTLAPTEVLRQGLELMQRADELDDPLSRMLACISMGLADLSRGQITSAEPRLAEAVDLATWHLCDSHWELLFSRFLLCITRIERGDLHTQSVVVARTLERCRRIGDLTGATLFAGIPRMWCSMAADRVEEAQDLIGTLESEWPPDYGAPLRSASALARAMGHIYLQNPNEAHAALTQASGTATGRRRRLSAQDIVRLILQARLAGMEGRLSVVAGVARTLERHGAGCALGHASLLRAHLAHRCGDSSGTVDALSNAIRRMHESGAEAFAMAARARLGQVARDERSAPLTRIADAWCKQQGIANPARMFDYLCPMAFEGDDARCA